MIAKVLQIRDEETDNDMQVFINTKNRIVLLVGDMTDDWRNEIISLDKEDVSALIKELQNLKKSI